ncbi:hypothetical protein VTI74DRAFT_9326 [Chaetomium olivicolor]
MSFKKFKSDVSTAAQKVTGGGVPGVLSVVNGDSDGEVVITYQHEDLSGDVRIQALAQDLSEYPDGNMFIVWTDDPNPPAPVVAAIKAAQDYLLGMSVYEMVSELAAHLIKEVARVADGEDGPPSGPEDDEGDDDEYDAAYDADYPSDEDEFGLPSSGPPHTHQMLRLPDSQKPLLRRIRRDLRQVKQAGYKVGLLDGFGKTATHGLVSISIRIDKLALSDEAMEAWDVRPSEYIVLLLRFERRYDPLETVISQPAAHTEVKFRIGKCNKYKPSPAQAVGAFMESSRNSATEADGSGTSVQDGANFEKLFISNSLDQFLCESFVSLLKLREMQGLSWENANEILQTRVGYFGEDDAFPETKPEGCPRSPDQVAHGHHVLVPDHLTENVPDSERSLPLIAMQFAMRYFVRCTEYCLRCHRRLENGFEALRPYVCSQPLCLFQYMAMGFGSSIEHEILTEPYVVDLLVSLCYVAIHPFNQWCGHNSGRNNAEVKLPIRSLPVGLRLMVPDLTSTKGDPLKGTLEANNTRLVLEDGGKGLGELLAPTTWVALRKPGQSLTHHARIQEVHSAGKTAFIEVVAQSSAYLSGTATSSTFGVFPPVYDMDKLDDSIVDVFPYGADFDALPDDSTKGLIIRHILDTLPSILDIEEWLSSHPHSTLRSMNRISPAAASLLQWIVSSNRSCIFQVDRERSVARSRASDCGSKTSSTGDSKSREDTAVAGRGRNREHERIQGMDGWVQFRFAQGSPDKELRFNRALQEVAARKPIQAHPTIFAWHGSNLSNWHSIVRTGLDFNDVRSGRAFGDGVYFSNHCATSMGYTGSAAPTWPNSDLGITSCLSLNEIINAPDEFVSSRPHYVVSQLDWHQCRYLFVQTAKVKPLAKSQQPKKVSITANTAENEQTSRAKDGQVFYPQAQGREVIGQDGAPLRIPLSAIPFRIIGTASERQSTPSKRRAQQLEDSDDDDEEDVAALFTDDDFDVFNGPPSKKSASHSPSVESESAPKSIVIAAPPTPSSVSIDRSLTDFEPGSLDLSTIQRLAPPSFATDSATRSLSRELMRLQILQSKTPLHELGWYIDVNAVTNLFQWIVQLHSFDPSLPLAQDMKAAGIVSIVLELRFPADFPYSPPFVRVIRPRFLPFMEGGGGHVTAGGAMCMELLTSSGWSPANNMESVFLQVRMAMCSLEPKPARLDRRVFGAGTGKNWGGATDYGVQEALEAFLRAAGAHGWKVPEGVRVTAIGI